MEQLHVDLIKPVLPKRAHYRATKEEVQITTKTAQLNLFLEDDQIVMTIGRQHVRGYITMTVKCWDITDPRIYPLEIQREIKYTLTSTTEQLDEFGVEELFKGLILPHLEFDKVEWEYCESGSWGRPTPGIRYGVEAANYARKKKLVEMVVLFRPDQAIILDLVVGE